jgi:hypothetical protein
MRFRQLVRGVAPLALLLAAVGCSSGGTPGPSSTGTQDPGSAATHSAGSAAGRTATGTVTVRLGGANGMVVCVITLKEGKGSCKVGTAGDKPGTVHYTGTYSGNGTLKAATSPTIGVRIVKAPTTAATK